MHALKVNRDGDENFSDMHIERVMGGEEMTVRIYKSGVDAVDVRGKLFTKREDRVLEYVREREMGLRGMKSA